MLKLILKTFLLLFLVYIIQWWIVKIYPPHIEPEIAKMEKELNQKKDILYFGDSVLFTSGLIPDMLQANLHHTTVGMVAHPADSAVVYLDYCRYLSRLSQKPKIVIIPISMRNFAIYWEMDPGRQFEEEKLHFRFAKTPLEPFMPFLISFKVFKLYPRTYDEFYHLPFMYKGKSLGTVNDYYGGQFETYSDEHMKKKIALSYLYELSSRDFVLDSIEKIQSACNFAKVVYYITPVPFGTGATFLGKNFIIQTDKNIAIVKDSLAKKHAFFIDMSHDVPKDKFIWENEFYISEHMTSQGEETIAEKLADFIQSHRLLSAH